MNDLRSIEAAIEHTARRYGLHSIVQRRPDGMAEVCVEREGDDWSLERTSIAIGHDPEIVSRRAIEALRKMGPKLQKRLDQEMPEPPDSLTLAAGVASDGTVTTLRVERDGTVRLSPDDIDAIATRVMERMAAHDPPSVSPERIDRHPISK